ncbi:hypothetical protein FA13DRAFT_329609 [Coprinellus micaceus]|uniref:Uncharacterized protein n=1 Tax=Coprinellus micaceus TaxID=71717 RepID=A0A4Y7SD72_COPMI|nr:hypothetical protein FA13DRAFT_329609 [Coprinellus micaceus]
MDRDGENKERRRRRGEEEGRKATHRLVSHTGEQPILVIGVLELLGVGLVFFAAFGAGFAVVRVGLLVWVGTGEAEAEGMKGKGGRGAEGRRGTMEGREEGYEEDEEGWWDGGNGRTKARKKRTKRREAVERSICTKEQKTKAGTTHATTSSLGPSLAGPISLLVVNPLAPRPRPATYDAGAGMERKASLFLGSLDAMFVLVRFLSSSGVALGGEDEWKRVRSG